MDRQDLVETTRLDDICPVCETKSIVNERVLDYSGIERDSIVYCENCGYSYAKCFDYVPEVPPIETSIPRGGGLNG